MKQGGYAIADTLRIGGLTWLNVPFAVIDTQTGHEEADKYNEKFQLPLLSDFLSCYVCRKFN